MAHHTVYWADMVNETFTNILASTSGDADCPNKRLITSVSFQHHNEGVEGIVRSEVRVAGELKYGGASLKEAIDIYNKF